MLQIHVIDESVAPVGRGSSGIPDWPVPRRSSMINCRCAEKKVGMAREAWRVYRQFGD